jgi:hypothetical protein
MVTREVNASLGSGRLSLGLRSVLELAPYIHAQYGERSVPECICCREFVVRGPACPTANCEARLHRRCALDWFSRTVRASHIIYTLAFCRFFSLTHTLKRVFVRTANSKVSVVSEPVGVERRRQARRRGERE